ncbi:hypothetical protein BN1708_019054, partial [Verticillium longisporum]
LLDPD